MRILQKVSLSLQYLHLHRILSHVSIFSYIANLTFLFHVSLLVPFPAPKDTLWPGFSYGDRRLKDSVGRPLHQMDWCGDLEMNVVVAQNGAKWNSLVEAYVQQWTSSSWYNNDDHDYLFRVFNVWNFLNYIFLNRAALSSRYSPLQSFWILSSATDYIGLQVYFI